MRRILPIGAPLLALAALLIPAPAGMAQVALSREIVTASRPLNDAEREAIDKFVDAQAALLESATAADVGRGRHELIQPPRTPGVSDIFRRAYADAVRARIRPLLKGDDEFKAVNALSVLPFLLTVESLDELADNASKANQPREAVRIAAARFLSHACRILASANPPYAFNPAQSDSFARKLREAASAETSWIALAEVASALMSQASWKLPPANQEIVRSEFLRVLERQVGLVEGSPETMRAVQRTLIGVRKQIIDLPVASRPAFAQQLTPILQKVKTIASKPPANASEALKKVFEQSASLVDQINGLFK